MKLTGGGPESFERIALDHIQNLLETVGLYNDYNFLELGSGISRDAIPLMDFISSRGSYKGVDIFKDTIDWCNSNIKS